MANARTTVIAVFEDRRQAQQAVDELFQAGFREDQIGVIAHDPGTAETEPGETRFTETHGTRAGEGALTGAVAGAGIGGLWAVGIVAGVLPGIGPAIAGGVLASILASAAGGAAAGGLVGALVGMGIPEEEARYYESEFRAGRTIVTVQPDGRYDEAFGICERYGAYDVHTRTP
jgi:hypothetical protein